MAEAAQCHFWRWKARVTLDYIEGPTTAQDMNGKYDRWWASDATPGPWMLAFLCLFALVGVFSIATAVLP
jgi:hypothetical protein